MVDTIYTRVLAQGVEMLGSTQALANVLHVPQGTLSKWLTGAAQTPLRAFLRIIELLCEHDKNAAHAVDAPSEQVTEKLAFSVSNVTARCKGCGGMEFLSSVPRNALRVSSRVECVACKLDTTYAEVIAALATQAVSEVRRARKLEQNARVLSAAPRDLREPERA
jgi:hypothetical protein